MAVEGLGALNDCVMQLTTSADGVEDVLVEVAEVLHRRVPAFIAHTACKPTVGVSIWADKIRPGARMKS